MITHFRNETRAVEIASRNARVDASSLTHGFGTVYTFPLCLATEHRKCNFNDWCNSTIRRTSFPIVSRAGERVQEERNGRYKKSTLSKEMHVGDVLFAFVRIVLRDEERGNLACCRIRLQSCTRRGRRPTKKGKGLSEIMRLSCFALALPPSLIVNIIIEFACSSVVSWWMILWLTFWRTNRENNTYRDIMHTETLGSL